MFCPRRDAAAYTWMRMGIPARTRGNTHTHTCTHGNTERESEREREREREREPHQFFLSVAEIWSNNRLVFPTGQIPTG